MNKNIISSIKIFKNKDKRFLSEVLPLLKPLKLLKNHFLFLINDLANDIYFILEGFLFGILSFSNPTTFIEV